MKSDNMKRHIWKSSLGIVSYRRKVSCREKCCLKVGKKNNLNPIATCK